MLLLSCSLTALEDIFMHIKKISSLLPIVLLISTRGVGMERLGNETHEKNAALSVWIQAPYHGGWKHFRPIPITLQPNLAQHIHEQVGDFLQQQKYQLPKEGYRLIYNGNDLNVDDEALKKALFKYVNSTQNEDIITMVPKALPLRRQEEPAQSWLSTITAMIKHFE
jgi:hypothetical protein